MTRYSSRPSEGGEEDEKWEREGEEEEEKQEGKGGEKGAQEEGEEIVAASVMEVGGGSNWERDNGGRWSSLGTTQGAGSDPLSSPSRLNVEQITTTSGFSSSSVCFYPLADG